MPVMTIKPGDRDPVRKPGHYTYGRQKIRDMERLTGKPFKGLGTAEIEKKGEQC